MQLSYYHTSIMIVKLSLDHKKGAMRAPILPR